LPAPAARAARAAALDPSRLILMCHPHSTRPDLHKPPCHSQAHVLLHLYHLPPPSPLPAHSFLPQLLPASPHFLLTSPLSCLTSPLSCPAFPGPALPLLHTCLLPPPPSPSHHPRGMRPCPSPHPLPHTPRSALPRTHAFIRPCCPPATPPPGWVAAVGCSDPDWFRRRPGGVAPPPSRPNPTHFPAPSSESPSTFHPHGWTTHPETPQHKPPRNRPTPARSPI